MVYLCGGERAVKTQNTLPAWACIVARESSPACSLRNPWIAPCDSSSLVNISFLPKWILYSCAMASCMYVGG